MQYTIYIINIFIYIDRFILSLGSWENVCPVSNIMSKINYWFEDLKNSNGKLDYKFLETISLSLNKNGWWSENKLRKTTWYYQSLFTFFCKFCFILLHWINPAKFNLGSPRGSIHLMMLLKLNLGGKELYTEVSLKSFS